MNAKDKFPGLTLMQCDEPEETGMYLCLIPSAKYGPYWVISQWIEMADGARWATRPKSEVIAWCPLPIPTEQELEQLYKAPISNDE